MIHRRQIHADRWLAGRVERYHTWPTIQRQTTRDHSCRVLQIFVEISGGVPRGEVLYWISWHDGGEQFAGDMPFGGKSSSPVVKSVINELEQVGLEKLGVEMPKLTEEEFKLAKLCDLLEMWEFSRAEMKLGNKYAEVMVSDTYTAALSASSALGVYQKVVNWMGER